MAGPLVLGIIGAAIVLAVTIANFIFVTADSPRYKLDLLNTYDGGADVKRMVQDQGRVTAGLVFGAAVQLAAIIWQAAAN